MKRQKQINISGRKEAEAKMGRLFVAAVGFFSAKCAATAVVGPVNGIKFAFDVGD